MQGSSGRLGKGPHAAHSARCTLWIRGHEIARTSALRLSQGTPADSAQARSHRPERCPGPHSRRRSSKSMRGAFSARLPASRMTSPRLATHRGVSRSATLQPWFGSSRQRICGAHRLQPAFGHLHGVPKRSRRPRCPAGERSAQGVSFRLLPCDARSAPTQNPEVLTVRIDACGTSKASASSRQGRRRIRKVNPAPGQRRVPVAGDASQPWWHSVCSGTTSCCHDKQGVSRLAGERKTVLTANTRLVCRRASPLVRRARHRGACHYRTVDAEIIGQFRGAFRRFSSVGVRQWLA